MISVIIFPKATDGFLQIETIGKSKKILHIFDTGKE
jgi:hypothetical protein